jgi:hypothetical protein
MNVVAETPERGDGPLPDATPCIRKARANAGIVLINRWIVKLLGDEQGSRQGCLSPNGDTKSGCQQCLLKMVQ